MSARMFKPGDRVQRKSGGPVMIVQRYARKHSPLIGWYESDYLVECSVYASGSYQREVIRQDNLTKVTTNLTFTNDKYTGTRSSSRVNS